jgi:hypothetical protein
LLLKKCRTKNFCCGFCWVPNAGWIKIGIQDKHPVSATLHCKYIYFPPLHAATSTFGGGGTTFGQAAQPSAFGGSTAFNKPAGAFGLTSQPGGGLFGTTTTSQAGGGGGLFSQPATTGFGAGNVPSSLTFGSDTSLASGQVTWFLPYTCVEDPDPSDPYVFGSLVRGTDPVPSIIKQK